MTIQAVADTHALIWYVFADSRISSVEIPVDRRIAESMRLVDRAQVPDLPDRIIAATAVHLGVPLISRDGKIRSSRVTTIW